MVQRIRNYTPYAVEQYLRSAGQVTIVRVLNTGGYSTDFVQVNISGSGAAETTGFVLAPSRGGSNGTVRLDGCQVTQSAAGVGSWSSFTLKVSGSNFGAKSVTSRDYTVSFNTSVETF